MDLGQASVVEAPTRSASLATLPEAEPPDLKSRLKIVPHNLYKVPPDTPLAPLTTPIFRFFTSFLKIFSPRLPVSVRRALNRRAAPSRHSKTAEFRGKTAHSRLAAAPKSPAKHPSGTPKTPPFTRLREKKLSKVRSTLLTHPLRGCILEYMRLKEPRRPPQTGRRAQYRPPPKLSNYPASH